MNENEYRQPSEAALEEFIKRVSEDTGVHSSIRDALISDLESGAPSNLTNLGKAIEEMESQNDITKENSSK